MGSRVQPSIDIQYADGNVNLEERSGLETQKCKSQSKAEAIQAIRLLKASIHSKRWEIKAISIKKNTVQITTSKTT